MRLLHLTTTQDAPHTVSAMPLSPEWAKLPKRHCDDCGKLYKQVRPRREGEKGFCSDNCRKSYHKHGGAYRKLKTEVAKMFEKEFKRFQQNWREIVREEIKAELIAAWQRGAWTESIPAPSANPSAPLPTNTRVR